MLGRRLLVLVAVLMGLTALAASLAPPPPERGSTGTATPTPSPTASAEASPAARPGATVTGRLSATSSAAPRQITAARGDLVDLVVTGDVVDTVAITGLPVLEPIDPDSPARVELFADTPGRFAIRLLDSGRLLGTLRISP
jgi:hypothetical protein